MIKYLRVDEAETEKGFRRNAQQAVDAPVLIVREKPPNSPHIKIEIKIVEIEWRYIMDRGNKIEPEKKRRWPGQRKRE